METGSEISIGNEIHNSMEGNMRKIEVETGLKFNGSVRFEYSKGKPLFKDDPDLVNPSVGFFDHSNRKVFINPEKLKSQKDGFYREIDEEYIKDHELLHILEVDVLGRKPEYPHLLHAFFDEAEKKRLVAMAFFIKDKNYQKIVFGREIDVNFNIKEESLFTDSVVEAENFLVNFMNEDRVNNLTPEKYGLVSLMASDLNLLKTVLFSNKVGSPKVAMKFDTFVAGLDSKVIYSSSIKVRDINDELKIINILNSEK